ncbi:MAG: 1,2-phenylacetyl-CoA epoxidase subunit PaaC [Phycisphaerae bacterium]
MNRYDSVEQLNEVTRHAVVDLLIRLADDEIVLGHRDSEWTGHGPILEEDIAFSSMAQDEMGHARAYYQLAHELGETDADTLAFGRTARQYRCASLVSLPNHRDWAFCVLRQFLYDSAETVRLTALCDSRLTPLAHLARKLRTEEKFHLMHGRIWVVRLGRGTSDSRERMQRALDLAYPHALGLFEPTEADEPLSQAGICPPEEDLQRQWESAVVRVLCDAGLAVPENARPAYGGRVGHHPEALGRLLKDMQLVYRIDPTAKW